LIEKNLALLTGKGRQNKNPTSKDNLKGKIFDISIRQKLAVEQPISPLCAFFNRSTGEKLSINFPDFLATKTRNTRMG